jgi:hypothetical protein
MKRLIPAMLGVLACPVVADEMAERFEPLAFLAGHCWQGEFPGGKSTDRHCFEWVWDRAHLRDVHVVTGGETPYCGETLYSWDAELDRIAFRYFNSVGGVSEGILLVGPEGIRSPEERYRDASGERVFRSTLVPMDADHYRTRVEQHKDGEWQETWVVDFSRVAHEEGLGIACDPGS